MPIELTDEMKEEYINHLAIVKDMSSEAYKEKYKDDISSENFARDAQRYFVLRKISQTCEFVIKEEPEENSYPESEIETIKEEQ
jgi:hypothetical protein